MAESTSGTSGLTVDVLEGIDEPGHDVLWQKSPRKEPNEGLLDQLLNPAFQMHQAVHNTRHYKP